MGFSDKMIHDSRDKVTLSYYTIKASFFRGLLFNFIISMHYDSLTVARAVRVSNEIEC